MRTRALASAGALSLVVSSHERIRAYVELKGGDIVVTLPGADYSVTYFKPEREPRLRLGRVRRRLRPAPVLLREPKGDVYETRVSP